MAMHSCRLTGMDLAQLRSMCMALATVAKIAIGLEELLASAARALSPGGTAFKPDNRLRTNEIPRKARAIFSVPSVQRKAS